VLLVLEFRFGFFWVASSPKCKDAS